MAGTLSWLTGLLPQPDHSWGRRADGELRKQGDICLLFVSGRGSEGQPASFGSWILGIVGILVLLKASRGCCAVSGRTLPAK